ncbi:unnamed protein product [Withania somnifera]
MASVLAALIPKLGSLGTSDHASVVSINLFVVLLCACIVIGHLLEENRWINESITALLIGLVTGVVILLVSGGKSSHLLVFSEDLFFIYLLPPIIFNAGFQVKKKQFFVNFITIMMFGAIGTLVSCAIISLGAIQSFKKLDIGFLDIGDYLAIGAIFAATDSVCTLQVLHQDETPLLYSLVFGEGVVNDATSVVLFNAIQNFDLSSVNPSIALSFLGNFFYLFLASTLLGAATGLLSAYIIKKLYFGRHSTDREVALMMLMAYLSYMLAEVIIWWAGLMRGAVSMALAYNKFTRSGHTQVQDNAIMVTSTITIVLFSTVVFGLMTKPLISLLLPPQRQLSTVSSDANTPKSLAVPLLGSQEDSEADLNGQDFPHPPSLRMLLMAPSHKVHRYWRKFDDTFMRPVFGGRGFAPPAPSSPMEHGA